MSAHQWVAGDEIYSGALNLTGIAHVTDTGSAGAYAADPQITTETGTEDGFSAYYAGLAISIIPANENPGASTFQLHSLGTKDIIRRDGSALLRGDMSPTHVSVLFYNGTAFELLNPLNNASIELAVAGEDLIANRGVVVHSDGEIYHPSITVSEFDPFYTELQVQTADSTTVSNAHGMRAAVCPSYKDTAGNGRTKVNVVTGFGFGANNVRVNTTRFSIEENTLAAIVSTDVQGGSPTSSPVAFVCPLTFDKAVVFMRTVEAGANRHYARVVNALDSTPGTGAALTVLSSNASDSIIGWRYTDTKIVTVYNDNSNLKAVILTEASSVLTAGTPSTLVNSGTVNKVHDIQRFGDTDYYLVAYEDNSVPKLAVLQWNGTTFTWGTPVNSGMSNSYPNLQIATLTDTKAVSAWGTNLEVVDRSGTTITVSGATSMGSTTASAGNQMIRVIKWDDYTAQVCYCTAVSTDFTVKYAIAKIHGTTVTVLSSPVGPSGNNPRRQFFGMGKLDAVHGIEWTQDTDDDRTYRTFSFQNDLALTVGIITEAFADGATAQIYTDGVVPFLSGLTPGLEYFIDMGGVLIPKTAGGITRAGVALSSSKLRID